MVQDIQRKRVILKGISSRAWEHPADRGALIALRKLKGFDMFVRKFVSFWSERTIKMALLGSMVKVTERQFPRVWYLYQQACMTLDVEEPPELFVQANPVLNAMTIGIDEPRIVINSALVDLLDDTELAFVLGHELGHAVSGHARYRTMLLWILSLGGVVGVLPFGQVAVLALQTALGEWARKAEYSADRAGLLATQDHPAAMRVCMKLASGGRLEDLDQTEFLLQAREYRDTEDMRDSIAKLLLTDQLTHPMMVARAAQLQTWSQSGEYTAFLAGGYPRRSDDDSARISEAAQAAADSYEQDLNESNDALTKMGKDLASEMGDLAKWIGGKFQP